MSATLRIARPDDSARVLRLVAACHDEVGLTSDARDVEAAVDSLLGGTVPGALYLIGPPSSPVGYLAVSFGHSISLGGTEALMDELYIRPSVRRRGMAGEAVAALTKMLTEHGVRALHVRVPGAVPGFLTRMRFAPVSAALLSRSLR